MTRTALTAAAATLWLCVGLASVVAAGERALDPCGAEVSAATGGRAGGEAGQALPAMAELWAWVREQTGLASAGAPPPVCVLSAADLQRIRENDPTASAGGLDLVALYDRDRTRILLSAPATVGDPVSESILVHELVHHAQNVGGKRFPCSAAAEKEAYDVQERWLLRVGLDLGSAFGLDRLTRFVLTTCAL